MSHESDLSSLDRPEILETVFPLAYSHLYSQAASGDSFPGAVAHFIEVEAGIRIGCGFWVREKEFPTILYFHGNGEEVGDHEWIAQYYMERGINLFVADYRGYGLSGGRPTITNLVRDSHAIFRGFKGVIEKEGFGPGFFVMGRSLGSFSTMEIAYHHQDELRGVIIESGSANNFRRLWGYLGDGERENLLRSNFLNKDKIRSVHIPTRIIHGEYDQILPVQEGLELYESSVAQDKEILIVAGADHNDLMIRGQREYFGKIEEFVNKYA